MMSLSRSSVWLLALGLVLAAERAAVGQAPTSSSGAGATSGRTGGYTAPRTPWGDPDLQGDYSNKYEQGTPLERPEEFAGRRIEEIKGDELTAILQERQDRVLLSVTLAGGDPAGNLGGPLHWQDQFDITKGSRPWFVIEPADGRIPPTTTDARTRAAARQASRRGRGQADSWIDRSLYDRCITRGLPGSMMPAIYGNSYRIVQAPGFVAIQYEMVHETRIIPLDPFGELRVDGERSRTIDGRAHVAASIKSHMGYAHGHWDGDTLVVETTNFRDESVYRGANPQTLKITERFTRVAPNRVEWQVGFNDPSTWTTPWSFAMPLTLDEGERIVEYACHEGNRAMANILSAARADETAVAEAAKKGIKATVRDIPTEAEGEK